MGEVYTKVYANAIGASTLDVNPSSGEEDTTLAHVYWERESGFTGTDWYTAEYSITIGDKTITARGPLHGFSDSKITEALSDGNLNDEFSDWEWKETLAVRSAWVTYVSTMAPSCVG